MTDIDRYEAEEILLRNYAIHGLEKARADIVDRIAGSLHPVSRSCADRQFNVVAIAHIAEIEEHLAFGIWSREYDAFSTAEIEDIRDAFLRQLKEIWPKTEPEPGVVVVPDERRGWWERFQNWWR